jgi:hypothetical protein
MALVVRGWAMCAWMPASVSRSANHPKPKVGLERHLERLLAEAVPPVESVEEAIVVEV